MSYTSIGNNSSLYTSKLDRELLHNSKRITKIERSSRTKDSKSFGEYLDVAKKNVTNSPYNNKR